MNSLAYKIAGLNLSGIVQAEGVQLRRSGKSYKGRCPFHEDKAPSFTVKENRFKCFGCNASGDAIQFIRDLKGFSFREACQYLGIETPGQPTTPVERKQAKVRVQERKRKQALLDAFRAWEATYSTEIGLRIRRAYAWIKKYVTGPEDLNGSTGTMLAEIYFHLPLWEEKLQILACGTDAEKYELYKEITNER